MSERVDSFIKHRRKICWEAEYEGGEYCIGEEAVRKEMNDFENEIEERDKMIANLQKQLRNPNHE